MLDQPPQFAAKGSQRWLQVAVNRLPSTIYDALRVAAKLPPSTRIEWVSPLASESFAEYSDGDVATRLGIELKKRPLEDFWPQRGPRWDGLARASTGDVFLVEAKAHVAEMVSGPCRASRASRQKIAESLRAVQREIAPNSEKIDWTGTFYQYANRLAHLHLLRRQNGVPAHLVYVYFPQRDGRRRTFAARGVRGRHEGDRALPGHPADAPEPVRAQALRGRCRIGESPALAGETTAPTDAEDRVERLREWTAAAILRAQSGVI
jgi:hypothetical protein